MNPNHTAAEKNIYCNNGSHPGSTQTLAITQNLQYKSTSSVIMAVTQTPPRLWLLLRT